MHVVNKTSTTMVVVIRDTSGSMTGSTGGSGAEELLVILLLLSHEVCSEESMTVLQKGQTPSELQDVFRQSVVYVANPPRL